MTYVSVSRLLGDNLTLINPKDSQVMSTRSGF